MFDAHAFFVRFVKAIDDRDLATLETMIHPDAIGDMPQSGERSYGFAGFKAQLEQYPNGGIRNPVAPEMPAPLAESIAAYQHG